MTVRVVQLLVHAFVLQLQFVHFNAVARYHAIKPWMPQVLVMGKQFPSWSDVISLVIYPSFLLLLLINFDFWRREPAGSADWDRDGSPGRLRRSRRRTGMFLGFSSMVVRIVLVLALKHPVAERLAESSRGMWAIIGVTFATFAFYLCECPTLVDVCFDVSSRLPPRCAPMTS